LVVDDQVGNPTSAMDFANGILTVARNLTCDDAPAEQLGVFHMASQGPVDWAEFAENLFAISAELGGPSARVVPIPSTQYRTRVRRPPNSRLDCAKIAAVHGVTLPHWRPALRDCIERILADPTILSEKVA